MSASSKHRPPGAKDRRDRHLLTLPALSHWQTRRDRESSSGGGSRAGGLLALYDSPHSPTAASSGEYAPERCSNRSQSQPERARDWLAPAQKQYFWGSTPGSSAAPPEQKRQSPPPMALSSASLIASYQSTDALSSVPRHLHHPELEVYRLKRRIPVYHPLYHPRQRPDQQARSLAYPML